MSITLKDIGEVEFSEEIERFMYKWDPDDSYADYMCGFCSARPETNGATLYHKTDCFGQRLLNSLSTDGDESGTR